MSAELFPVEMDASADTSQREIAGDVEATPSALMERVSELDANIESDLGLKLNPGRRAPDTNDIVLASGDSLDADEILDQIPNRGLPVTVITGFLGSGKTSLVNYILTQVSDDPACAEHRRDFPRFWAKRGVGVR